MDQTSAKPRVNGSMLSKHIGDYVCLVGKNAGIVHGGSSMTLETSDHQRITLHFPRPLQEAVDQYVEVLGCVEPDLSVSVERIVNYGVDFDLEAYNEVVQLVSSLPQLFSSAPVKAETAMQF